MRPGTVSVIAVILVFVFLASCPAGCASGPAKKPAAGGNIMPFDASRVATVRLVMSESAGKECLENAAAEQYVQADFWFDDELVPDVAVRPKGNASLWETLKLGNQKFGFKVDFNFFNRARTFHGIKKLNFNNGWADPTFMREFLAYEIFEQMDIPTPRNSFVDLWLNDTHLGVYTMVEQIDLTFLTRHFSKSDGNLYKPRIPVAFLDWTEEDIENSPALPPDKEQATVSNLDVNLGGGNLGEIIKALEPDDPDATPTPAPGGLLPGEKPSAMDMPPDMFPPLPLDYASLMQLRTNENNPDHSALFRFLDVINKEPEATFPQAIEKVLDVDQMLRYLAVSTVLVHLDNYIGLGHNYYLYEIDGKFTILPWDLNMAFGTYECIGMSRDNLINFCIDEPTGCPVAERPLVKRLLSYPPYLDTYHQYIEELLAGPFTMERMESRIDQVADLLRPYVKTDTRKFHTTADFDRCLDEDLIASNIWDRRFMKVGYNPIGLKAFVRERWESVRQQLDGERRSSNYGRGNGGNLWMLDFKHGRVLMFPPPPKR